MQPITLRPYQQQAVDESREALRLYNRVMLQLATGGGKTVIFSHIAALSQKRNKKVLILSSRTEILMQNGGVLERLGMQVDYVTPKQKKIPLGSVISAMAQTLKRRIDKPQWQEWLKSIDLLIIDEAHEQISDFIHDCVSSKCYILGTTATPRRYGNMNQLGAMYKALVTVITISELIELGYLSKPKLYAITAPKLDIKIDRSNGDYNQKSLSQKFESKILYKGVVDEYIRLTPNRKAICFCVSSKQAIELTKEFVNRGVPAKYLLSNTFEEDTEHSGDRKVILQKFKDGEISVLVNVGIAVAGLDVPDIEVVIANFATISLTKWKQAIGRGARIAEGKNGFTILDCGNNFQNLGMYEDEPKWCLWHDTGANTGIQPLKQCDIAKKDINGKFGCGIELPMNYKECPVCGYVFVTEKHEYEMKLEEVVKGIDDAANLTIAQYCASKKLEGWNNRRILIQVCLRNADNDKKAFIEAAETLGVNPFYWSFFKRNIWDNIKSKRQ